MFAKKSLGQNFLMHQQTADRIAASAPIEPADTVLEVGPGTGMLTQALLSRSRHVIAIEADSELVPGLRERFATETQSGALTLVDGDVRNFDPSSIQGSYRFVANIPYYITGELIRMFLSATHKPRSMTILVQKEVAERIAREKKGSLLKIAVEVYGTPSYVFTVPRGSFVPAPSVDSAVLFIDAITNPFASTVIEVRFFEVLRAGFAHKRKVLRKNLESVASPQRIATAFSTLALAPTIRAEELSVSDWVRLGDVL